MDVGIFVALAMLIVWAAGTFFYEAPGWLHVLLTVGVFLLIWRIVVRSRRPANGRARSGRSHERGSR
jgi:uncharacterized membrane protein